MGATLRFFGAAGCVTGACFLVETPTARVLVDCGMFQGSKTLKGLNYGPFPFQPSTLDAVLLTHAHIDHSGLLPKLMLAGFAGRVHATPETKALCGVLLPDAGAIQEMEVQALNERRRRAGEEDLSPIFTAADAKACLAQFQDAPFHAWGTPAPGVRARWWPAGHILGAASIELELDLTRGAAPMRLLFSGDIGPGGRETAQDPQGPAGVDHLILEATYGDETRSPVSPDKRRAALADAVCAAHAAGGPLLIPAFAVERTQELIVDLLQLMEETKAPPGPIFLDSPLAIKACDVFLRCAAGAHAPHPFRRLRESSRLHFTQSVAESRSLERFHGWHIIIAGSGMCEAGRIRHHLKRLLWRKDATVVLTGYQAIGTLGRLLQEGRKRVRIQGEEIRVHAEIKTLDVYSGHADADGLVRWALARRPVSGAVFLTHGEPPNQKGLAKRLAAAGFERDAILTPHLDARYSLAQTRAVVEEAHARLDADSPSRLDWHNARAALLADLDAQLQAAPSDAAREALLERLARGLQRPG